MKKDSNDYKITYQPEPDYLAAFIELCALQIDTIRKLAEDEQGADKKLPPTT